MRASNFLLIAAFGVVTFANGCLGKICDTAGPRPSVVVTVLDESGEPIEGSTVTFAAGDDLEEPCSGGRPEHVCGFELEGDLTIHVVHEGYLPVDVVAHVPGDQCHVETQAISIELEPEA